MNEIERVERIGKSTTAARGIEIRTGTEIEAVTGVVVIPANGLADREMKKFESI